MFTNSRINSFVLTLTAFVVCGFGSAMNARADSIVLFNTGVSAPGMPAPNGSTDTHYRIISGPGVIGGRPAIVASNSAWLVNDSTSQWISISPDTEGPTGRYTYRIIFDLTGFDPATASITGRWATDNPGTNILINGTATGQLSLSSTSFTNFSVTAGFIAGVNTLDFQLINNGGPTGLRVEMTGTAFPPQGGQPVPEPATMFLLSTGLAGVAARLRRRRKAIKNEED